MAYELVYLPLAVDDLAHIVRYLALECEAPEAASQLIQTLDEVAQGLRELPYRFAIYPVTFALRHEVRFVPVGAYNLFYQVREERQTVEVLRVLHQRQKTQTRL